MKCPPSARVDNFSIRKANKGLLISRRPVVASREKYPAAASLRRFFSCIEVKRSTGHTHTPTDNNTPDTDTHTHTTRWVRIKGALQLLSKRYG